MKFYLRFLILALFLAPGIYFAAGRFSIRADGERSFISSVGRDAAKDENKSNAETTIRVLKENCGQCHQSSLPTANQKALAIFDLDKEPWYASVSDKHLEGISRRIGNKTGISDSDRAAILEFIAGIRRGGGKDNE